jgi:hypothetical protein
MTTTALEAPTTEQKRRGGPPLGSCNNFRHGLRGSNLPKGCQHIQRATCAFRRQLEASVMEARGEVSLTDAAFVNTAYRAERHAQLAQRWLALEAANMTPADRLNYSREVVRASEQRDKAIASLNLGRGNGIGWTMIHTHGATSAEA